MKIIHHAVLPLLISCLFISCSPSEHTPFYTYTPDELLISALDEVMETQIENGRIAGGVVMISREDKMIAEKAWGWKNREDEEPMESHHLFRIASMTKAITSAAILQLYEDEKLSLYDPVEMYIPEFVDPVVLTEFDEKTGAYETVSASRSVTIHDLLTHTSGVPYGFTNRTYGRIFGDAGVPELGSEEELTIEETMATLGDLPLAHDPGERYTYGLNTDVLGRVVEVASGMSLADYFSAHIFEPLNLNDIGFYLPGRESDLTRLYSIQDSVLVMYPEEDFGSIPPNFPVSGAMTYYSGGAGLTSSTADYHTFLSALHHGGAFNGNRILEESTVSKMAENQIGELSLNGNKFGYGLMITTEEAREEGKRSAGSLSWGGIYQSTYWIDSEHDMIVVLMTQVLPSLGQAEFYDRFERAIYAAIGE
ncbi:MAG: class A beta-lactamase-related serine hydrolase [Balneolaceae bacterium]|nr:MAG: class A beta-lactamase-related serine hydrolase [Balneolaceae bacterium]